MTGEEVQDFVTRFAAAWAGRDGNAFLDLWHPDAVEELHSYGIRPTRSIDELRRLCAAVRNQLAEIRAPVLVLHGERDRSIDPRCAREIARRLIGSEVVELKLLPRSGHAISVDVDRDIVNAEILRWFERFAPAARAAATAGR